MDVAPCTAEHLRALDVDGVDEERELRAAAADAHPEAFNLYGRTLLCDGRPVACIGVSISWPGVCEVWTLISEEARGHPVELTRHVLRELEAFEQREGVRRVSTSVKDDFEVGHRWIKRLGFEYEGLARNYGFHGVGDYAIYARVH